jgi:hypothetical protein
MSDDDAQSRSERLRQRRQGRSSETAETSEAAQTAETSKTSQTSEQSETSKPSKTSVKEERVGTYLYLSEPQKKDVDRLYNVLKAEYEYEYDEEFEKNRHFYPLLVQYGLNGLDGLDAAGIQERLDSI